MQINGEKAMLSSIDMNDNDHDNDNDNDNYNDFKISETDHLSYSSANMFDLSNSKQRDLNFGNKKCSKDEISDIFKEEISTLKDYSNLCSSK